MMSSMQEQANCCAGRTTGPYFSMRNPTSAGKMIWLTLPQAMMMVPIFPLTSTLLPRTFQMVAHVGAIRRPRRMTVAHTTPDCYK